MKKVVLSAFMIFYWLSTMTATDSLKGIWSDVKSFPPFTSAFWKGLGQSFGMAPSGYQFSFVVYNDMQKPVYFTINEIMSIMGADLPKPHGLHLYAVAANGGSQSIINQPYYFPVLHWWKRISIKKRL